MDEYNLQEMKEQNYGARCNDPGPARSNNYLGRVRESGYSHKKGTYY